MANKNENDELNLSDFKLDSRNCCNTPKTRKIFGIIYDIITALVSILDVITDIIVLIQFYISDKMIFFYISLIILLIAQLAYIIAFLWRMFDALEGSPINMVIAFFCLLPFAPFLSFVFYFTGDDESPLYEFFYEFFDYLRCKNVCCNNRNNTLKTNNNNIDEDMEAFREWIFDKLMKHIGFVIESLIEAFPQSILQLIAIVYYNEYNNYISMLSILLSMLSVTIKSFTLSIFVSYNWKSAIFNWISCVIDFFAIFFIVSFAFNVPINIESTENDINPFFFIRQVWIYITLISIIPCALVATIAINMGFVYEFVYDWHGSSLEKTVIFIIIQFVWIIVLFLTLMSMTIVCFILIAILIAMNGLTFRLFSQDTCINFYLPLISFIKKAKTIKFRDYQSKIIISQNQHRSIRICCVNRVLFETIKEFESKRHNRRWLIYPTQHFKYNKLEKELYDYLVIESKPKGNDIPYLNVTFNDIRSHSENGNFCGNIKKMLKSVIKRYNVLQDDIIDVAGFIAQYPLRIVFGMFVFICIPLYILGRLFNVFFVVFILCYLSFVHNINIFTEDIPLFQTIMCVCYLMLFVLWIILICYVLLYEYYGSFILPATDPLRANTKYEERQQKTVHIMDYYYSVIGPFVARNYFVALFGKDITMLILQFYGAGLYEELESIDGCT